MATHDTEESCSSSSLATVDKDFVVLSGSLTVCTINTNLKHMFSVDDFEWSFSYNYKEVSSTLESFKTRDSFVAVVKFFLTFSPYFGFGNKKSKVIEHRFRSSELKQLEKLPVNKSTELKYGGMNNSAFIQIGIWKKISTTSTKASNDFLGLLLSEHNSDVVLLVDGREFKAHKAILAARSPVFSAMFRHDMLENAENRATIEDVDHEIFSDLLKFVYSGTMTDLEDKVFQLLPIAERFGMDDLKDMCRGTLFKKMNVDNVANAIVAAEIYRIDGLQERAFEFVKDNWKDVVRTEGFEDMLKSHTDLANKVLRYISQN